MKKKCAVFTIVKNEGYFLPKWIKHYKRFFDNGDIYVLDHQSDDGSTDDLDVNLVEVTNDLAFDHQWLVETVQNFQQRLLQEYECVLFTESDEIVYSVEMELDKMVDEFISSDKTFLKCVGYEIMQDLEKEGPLGLTDSIIENRSKWFAHWLYNKPLLSKVPTYWCWGFHNFRGYDSADEYSFGFTLCHLHRVDFEFMLSRHEERANKWKLKDDGKAGHHHRIGDREGVLKYFNKAIDEDGLKIVEIPEEHKKALSGL